MSVVDVTFTVGGTDYVLPLRSIKPASSVADQPQPMLVGQATAQTGVGAYSTYCKDFSGPIGQEFWDMDSEVQGFRSGALIAPFGYLQLAPGATEAVSDTATTTPKIMPSSIGAAMPAGGTDDYRVVLPLGKEIHWCAAGDLTSWSTEYVGTANVTQCSGLIKLPMVGTPYGRLYASFASNTDDGDFNLMYSNDYGDSWSDSGIAGEAICYHHIYGPNTFYHFLYVAKQDGTITRYGTGGHTGGQMLDQAPGRVTFLAPEFGNNGVFFIKNGNLYSTKSDDPTTPDYDTLQTYPNLSGLVCGTMLSTSTVAVTTGSPSGIWKVSLGGEARWIGLPPNMAGEYAKIVYLLAVEDDLVALATNAAGTNTTVLICPYVLTGGSPEEVIRSIFYPPEKRAWIPAYANWQPLAVIAKKPYAAVCLPIVSYVTYQATKALFIMCYDGSGSYIYHMPMPTHGSVAPGGNYASGTHSRVMPTFAPMPEMTGPFFGVDIGYDIDEVAAGADEAIRMYYSTDGSDPTTEIGDGLDTVGRGAYSFTLSTPVAARALELKVSLIRGSTATYTPRVLWMAPRWHKKRPLRQSWLFEVDTIEWMRRESKTYDGLMADIATIHNVTTPPSMTIGKLTTTYKIDVERVTPEWGEAETPDRVGPIQLLVQEIP